jgi:hypothetical protein
METNIFYEAAFLCGRRQALVQAVSQTIYAQALSLREMRTTKAYRKLRLTWPQFCLKYGAMSDRAAKQLIALADEFGEPYFRLNAITNVPPELFRRIAPLVTAHAIVLDGEKVYLVPDNYVKICDGIKRLRVQLRYAPERCGQFLTPADTDLNLRSQP